MPTAVTATGEFKDHFSDQSADYARYRPQYPQSLFDFLAGCCERRDQAWDCATGNGQSALSLANYFNQVVATDASAKQIDNAIAATGITYRVAPAEQSGLDDESVEVLQDRRPPWGYEYFPSLSVDGKLLLFSESRFDQRDFYSSNFQIFTKDLNTNEVRRVSNDSYTNRYPRYLPSRAEAIKKLKD